MSSEVAVGLDLGSTSAKAVAVGRDGRVVGEVRAGIDPGADRTRQDPGGLWEAARGALAGLVGRLGDRRPAAVALSGAMHSLLLAGEDGTVLEGAWTWADGRAAPQAAQLRRRPDARELYRRTGCPLQAPYLPARLARLAEEEPEALRRAERVAGLKDWVLHRLTGRWATDVDLASTTGLLDAETLAWHPAALRAAGGLEEGRLPDLVETVGVVGEVTAAAARASGLPAGVPVVAGGSDGGLANLGAGASRRGEEVVTVGTTGAVRRTVDRVVLDAEGMRTWCYVLTEEGRWFAGGAINNGGLVLEWVRRLLYGHLDEEAGYARLVEEAAAVEPGADGVVMTPYLTGERTPHWDPDLRASVGGLAERHGRAHLARAALEGVCHALAGVRDLLGEGEGTTRVTGAICRFPAWVQMLADVLGDPLAVRARHDASSLGAALLALQALGWARVDEAAAGFDDGPVIDPDPGRHRRYAELRARFEEAGPVGRAPGGARPDQADPAHTGPSGNR